MPFRALLLALACVLLCAQAGVAGDAATVRGRITDPSGLPLPGVAVTLVEDATSVLSTATTDQEGVYEVMASPGRYHLTAELSGFEAAEQRDIVVGPDPVEVNLRLSLGSFSEAVTVSADSPRPLLGDPTPNAPATVTRQVIDSAMLPNSRYDDVLTLMPGVVRGPDGQISIAGARPTEGSLFVNGVNMTDPTSGRPGLIVPIEAVDTVQVHGAGYPAELGPATAGVTSIQTRSGADHHHVSLDSMFPRLLFEDGSLHGVEYWEPNVGVSGPLVGRRAFFEQGLSYRFDQNHFHTLAGTEHSIFNAPLSWSQVDSTISANQHLRASFGLNAQYTDHAHITAFTPEDSVPASTQNAWTLSLFDRLTIDQNSTLEAGVAAIRTTSAVVPYGTSPFMVGHDLLGGSYYDSQALRGDRIEADATYTRTFSTRNLARAGISLGRASLDENDDSAPVSLLRSDGSVSRRVSFLPTTETLVRTFEGDAFVQDTWTPRPWVTLDGGIRYDRTGALANGEFSPRIAWTLGREIGGTTVSGSAGIFADKVVLTALAFPSLPWRIVRAFDPLGAPVGDPLIYANAIGGALQAPRATRWDLGFDRRLAGVWQLHTRYQERHGRQEPVVRPTLTSTPVGVLTLTSDGTSDARSLETTIGYGSGGNGHQVYLSYVRSSSRGNLNSLDAVNGLYKEPFVQPDETGPLPADVPNRVLAWGLIQTAWHVTVAPFVDIRDGFPYSPIDDNWLYAAPRNSARLPWFGTLDLSVTRIVDLPRQLPHARVGLRLYNLVAVNTERDVQRDIASPEFGTRYDALSRDFAVVCVFLLGHH